MGCLIFGVVFLVFLGALAYFLFWSMVLVFALWVFRWVLILGGVYLACMALYWLASVFLVRR